MSTSSAARPVSNPVSRTWPETRGSIVGVRQLAAIERQTAAADALGQSRPQPLELRDSLIDARSPLSREAGPVAPGWDAVGRQFGELRPDFVKAQPDRK